MKTRLLSFAVCILLLGGCKDYATNTGSELIVDPLPGECPFMTTDAKGDVILSWLRKPTDSTAVFCYAKTSDGKQFTQTNIITTAKNIHPHSENLPKIIFKANGDAMALWGSSNPNPKNKHAGLVFYSQSFDDGISWTAARVLTNDTASIDQRYYDVSLLPNGEIGIIWLDNRKTGKQQGSALYYASTNGRDGFANEHRIAESCCQCCRTDLYTDQKGNIHVLYRGILQDTIRDMVHAMSVDGGKTFSSPKRICSDNWDLNSCPHTGPSMTENKTGMHFAWFTGGNKKGCYFTSSGDLGNSFNKSAQIASSGSHPQLTTTKDGDLMIVWDETIRENDNFYKRIGFQQRSATGAIQKTSFLTEKEGAASYPVIAPLNKGAVVGYCKEVGGREVVVVKIIYKYANVRNVQNVKMCKVPPKHSANRHCVFSKWIVA
ncbi:MAG: exo-alpha-sialidase [Chitinophagaceae bacterium]|nr:exo-alpha-sialidase [Chitinophagaceae bacterium]